jgi:hypothetical protein
MMVIHSGRPFLIVSVGRSVVYLQNGCVLNEDGTSFCAAPPDDEGPTMAQVQEAIAQLTPEARASVGFPA